MIDVSPDQLQTIKDILKRHAPDCEVRAFGSRFKWTAKDHSDLDLAFVGSEKLPFKKLSALKNAFEESDLPYRVDVLDWHSISPEFQKVIEQGYEVIQKQGLVMSSNGWNTYKLDEFARLIKEQYTPNQDEEFSYIGLEHIEQQTLRLNGIGKSSEAISQKFKFSNGDILFGKLRPYFRKVYRPKFNGVCSTDIWVVRAKEEFDQGFLFYFLANQEFIDVSNSGSSGTRMPRADWTHLAETEWDLPDIHVQRRIADILSALDEKIELNRQTNVTLEAMAQSIFREWFVEFNFPGATGEMVESRLGMMPHGWKLGKLGDIYKTTSGGTPSRTHDKYYENGTYQWVKSKELNGSFIIDTEEKITKDALKNSSAKLLPKHSVLIAMYGATVGEIGIISNEATTNQAICAFIPNANYPFSFILQLLKNNKDDIISRAVGSAQQNISQELLRNLELIIPEDSITRDYHTIVEPIFLVIEENIKQSAILAVMRDTLLPKLMGGEIVVS